MTKEKNFFHVRGDTLAFNFKMLDYTDALTGAYFSCKKNYDATDYIFQKSLGDGITSMGDGVYEVRVAPEDTAEADIQAYYYDLRIEAGNDVYTIVRGIMTLVDQIGEVTSE